VTKRDLESTAEPNLRSSLPEHRSEEIDYRAVSPWAVLASVLGIASPLAWVHPLLWAVPALAIVVGSGALFQVYRASTSLVGRKAAWFGLLAGIVCGVAAPLSHAVHQMIAEREARQIGLLWLGYLCQNEPQKAQQLIEHPRRRLPADRDVWAEYRDDIDLRERFDKFVRRPLVRTLLALHGPKVRFYATEGTQAGKRLEVFHERYAVTWEDAQKRRRTMLVRLDLHRVTDRITGEIGWFVNPRDDISNGEQVQPESAPLPALPGDTPKSTRASPAAESSNKAA
jgi:hypothetical protein